METISQDMASGHSTTEPDFLVLPADIVRKIEREQELAYLRKRKFEAKNPGKSHHKNIVKEFIFWDGEGPQDTGYSLFGNSKGDEICYPNLRTVDCLNLILERGQKSPQAIHVIYGGNYDASMILRELSWRHLRQLKQNCSVIWRGYRLQYVPRKWLSVSNGKTTVKIFDVVSFFACAFQIALQNFKIGTPEEIQFLSQNKANRENFLWKDIEDIKPYMRMELRLGVELMNKLRETFETAGFHVRSWHGPGALARVALNRHKVHDAMATSPPEVQIATMHAFAGGRFEMPKGGFINERICNADLRSAYPNYARFLPNLAKGRWRYSNQYMPNKFGVYHIRYKYSGRRIHSTIYPLFSRLDSGEVVWPAEAEGWYWSPEAELVANDPDATFIEGWVFDEEDSNDRPFAWIEDYYNKRALLKKVGNPAEFTFKLIINSVYGQLAQRTGWDQKNRKPPRYHQLEWAGYITSACRAAVYKAAKLCADNLISIDTDGIYARKSVPVSASPDLGGWEIAYYNAGVFWQSGIYSLRNGTEWEKAKSRGIPKGSFDGDLLLKHLKDMTPLKLSKNLFIGFGLALNGQFDRLNTWERHEHTFEFGGQGKRYHNQARCKKYCPGDGVHVFVQRPLRFSFSVRHRLPWLVADTKLKEDHETLVAFDLNSLDEDERWVVSYV
jgi:DNA polymerase type B, organellar and viral